MLQQQLTEVHIGGVTMVNLLFMKPVEVIGGIVDWPPRAGNEEMFLCFYAIPRSLPSSGAEEFWSYMFVIHAKPLSVEKQRQK